LWGGFGWSGDEWHLRREAADTFIELGIIFLLFLGGLEVRSA
jgi:Kef-type K+ transport system membrane component KefB